MLAAAQKLAEGVPEEKVKAIIDTYSRWNAVIDSVVDGLDKNGLYKTQRIFRYS